MGIQEDWEQPQRSILPCGGTYPETVGKAKIHLEMGIPHDPWQPGAIKAFIFALPPMDGTGKKTAKELSFSQLMAVSHLGGP